MKLHKEIVGACGRKYPFIGHNLGTRHALMLPVAPSGQIASVLLKLFHDWLKTGHVM